MNTPAQPGKLRVLMVAFACNPEGSGEHWLGWGWAEQAAKFCDVTLLTWNRFGPQVEGAAKRCGIHPLCVGVPGSVDSLGDRGGLWRWFRQAIWHRRATAVAWRVHQQLPFHLVHQTTFHSFRMPVRAAGWGLPALWGPVAGGESTPPGFGPWLGGLRIPEALRKSANRLALYEPGVQRSLRRVKALFVSNHTTLNFLPPWCHDRCRIVPPNALRDHIEPLQRVPRAPGEPLRLLFVGNCVATRAMPLVFEALRRVPEVPWDFHIVGPGSALPEWKRAVKKLGWAGRVNFPGQVPREALRDYYSQAGLFVFPALRDAGGSGLLEAMSLGLPVVCCDWAGPAEMVDQETGVKVSVATPELAISGFADTFRRAWAEPKHFERLGSAAAERVPREFCWTRKGEILRETYDRLAGLSR